MSASYHAPVAEAPIDSPERRRLPPLLRRAWYGLNQAFRRRLAHLNVTPDQFTVMRTLLEHENITQRQLTELISSDPNTIGSLMRRMQQSGLAEKRPDAQDRRANRLRLTARGKRKYEQARAEAVRLQSEVLAVLPPQARETFLTHLNRVADACRAAADISQRRPRT